MALLASRYSKIYAKLSRPDVAQNFPRHVFLREPNKMGMLKTGTNQIIVKHENVLDSTLIHLTEPFTNTELYLIGTMNSSNIFANRTKKLIQDVKPDTLFVQTNEQWWRGASMLGHVKSQEEFELANSELSKAFEYKMPFNSRKVVYQTRFALMNVLFKSLFGLPMEYNPFLPGLEVKYALEEANKLNTKVEYLGYELDPLTRNIFLHENRYGVLKTLINMLRIKSTYAREILDYHSQIKNYGVKKFVESSCDQYFINWVIQNLDIVFPDVKRVIIEKKEEELFKQIMARKGQKTVAVVNQIHMEGLEHHWCHSYGQLPRNVRQQNINPIGDMDLRDMLFSHMFHVISRDVKTSFARTTPASYSDHIIPYYRESNMQYEHRNM